MMDLIAKTRFPPTVSIPAKITAIYLAVGILWILFSDAVLGWVVRDPAVITGLSIAKGCVYVFLTALMLYLLVRRGTAQLKQAERADVFRLANERMELALRGSNVMIWDVELPDDDFNHAQARYVYGGEPFGYEPFPGPGIDSIEQMVHPDDRAAMREAARAYLAGETAEYKREVRHVRSKDGGIRTLLARGIAERDATGKPIRFAGTAVDITDLKRVEHALQERTKELACLYAVSRDIQADLSVAELCQRAIEHLVPAMQFPEITVPVIELNGERFALDTYTPGLTFSLQAEIEAEGRIFGHLRVYHTEDKPFLIPEEQNLVNAIAEALGVCLERKRAEEALRASERRFRVFVDHAVDAFFLHDEESRIVDVNRRACESLGYTREELIEMNSADFDPDLTPARIEELKREVLAGKAVAFESRHRRKDGTVFPVEVRGQAFEEGGRHFVVNLARDITERKNAEKALRQAKEAAEAANRAKDEFLANISHEIRTPMNAIVGMTELVLETELTEDQRQCLATVTSAADNLLGMLNDLLDFSKIEAGKLELAPTDFSLRTIVGDTLRVLAARARKKGLELVSRLEPDVPDALIGDDSRLRQILLNVVGNAVKFTERGSVRVEVEAVPDDGPVMRGTSRVMLRFRVRDTGIGIPKDEQQRIFRAFEQEDSSTTRKYGGTGLGLTIASRLVELMGGTISVESEPGRGSSFTFTAQFDRQAVQPESAPAGQAEPVATAPSAGLRILVAEDNEFNAQLMLQVLGRLGHRVRVAKDGREALTRAESGDYDVMLLDIHMPEMDGFQVIRTIRAREAGANKHLPVIALTASARSQDRDRCLAEGMDDFLAKPIKAAQLKVAIERAVARTVSSARAAAPTTTKDSSAETRPFPTDLIDSAVLLGACGGDQLVLLKLCRALQDHLPQQLSALRMALNAGDGPRLRDAAHKLCGMVAAFSTTAASVASAIEDHANDSQLDAARPLVDKLAEVSQQLVDQAVGLSIESLRTPS